MRSSGRENQPDRAACITPNTFAKRRGRRLRLVTCAALSLATFFIALAGTAGTITFGSSSSLAATYPVGAYPDSVVVGDFNRDGKLDIVTANYDSDNISVLIGRGDGTFQPAGYHPVACFGPESILVSDFNADGKLDLATGDSRCGNISVLLGNGDESFQNASPTSTAGCPGSLVAGFFDADTRLDIFVVNGELCLARPVKGGKSAPDSPESFNTAVLFGNGNGTFQFPVGLNAGSGATRSLARDFNGDGKLDLAVTNFPGNFVSVFLGNGNGAFQNAVNNAVASRPVSITSADFNSDGKLDLAAASSNTASVSVMLGNGNGSFQTAINYPAGTGALGIIAVDFNGDLKPDLATANFNDNNVSVLFNNGDGTFQPAIVYTVGSRPVSLASGDFNGDGRLDLVTANSMSNNVSVLLNCAGATSAAPASQFFQMNGGAGSVSVLSPGGCNWTVVSNDTWIAVVSADSGTGNSTVDYEVRENFSGSARQGSLSIAGSTFIVIQDGGLGEDCNYSIAPAFQTFSAAGGSGAVTVSAEERCAWQAVSDVTWMTITSANAGIGGGGVNYSVAANPSPSARKGKITVNGQVFAVKQKGN